MNWTVGASSCKEFEAKHWELRGWGNRHLETVRILPVHDIHRCRNWEDKEDCFSFNVM